MFTLAIIGLLFRPLGLLIFIFTIIIMGLACWLFLWLTEPAKPPEVKPVGSGSKKSKKTKPQK